MQKQKGLSRSRGFTIIELIVVIAIIAVLATIVMINVTQYIAKGKDASIKGNMSSIAVSAAAFYDNTTPSNFTGLKNNAVIQAAWSQLNTASGTTALINSNATAWCACANLVANSSNSYCVDSTGYKGETAGKCDAATTCGNSVVCH